MRDEASKYSIKFDPPKGDNFSIKIFRKGVGKPVARLEYHYELGHHELHFHLEDMGKSSRIVIWRSL